MVLRVIPGLVSGWKRGRVSDHPGTGPPGKHWGRGFNVLGLPEHVTTKRVAQNSRNLFSPVLEASALNQGVPGPHPHAYLPAPEGLGRPVRYLAVDASLQPLPPSPRSLLSSEPETSLSFLLQGHHHWVSSPPKTHDDLTLRCLT